jgi:hypothetical protein
VATAKLPGLSAHFTIEAGREPAITERTGTIAAIVDAGRQPAGGFMSEDWFVAAVRRVSDAGRAACESVEAAVHALEAGRDARLAGRPASAIVDELIGGGGRDVRLGAALAFRQFEREVQSMRVWVIRAMIDEEGLTLTEASGRLGISRQAGARLYRSQGDRPAGPPLRM